MFIINGLFHGLTDENGRTQRMASPNGCTDSFTGWEQTYSTDDFAKRMRGWLRRMGTDILNR
ncbi:MAG: hypothetical protein HYZ22_15780 [Chloroflexi bacterium]|nr:hypothetical protein [Chloroflexota bacterium]